MLHFRSILLIAPDTVTLVPPQLGLDYVNLYLLHHPAVISDLAKTWKEVEQAKELGLTKTIGISNATVAQLEQIAAFSTIAPAVNQVNPQN